VPTKPNKKPTVEFFQELDGQIKKLQNYTGELLKYHAIEWLRYESLRRAYADHQTITKDLSHDHYQVLCHVREEEHHWLISQDKNPTSKNRKPGWVIPYIPQTLQGHWGLLLIKPGQEFRGPNRVTLGPYSVNVSLPDKVLCDLFKAEIKNGRKAIQRTRAHGGGRTYSLAKLWDTLLAYDKYMEKKDTPEPIKLCYLHEETTTFSESETTKIKPLAITMIESAKKSPSAFHQTFG